nr:hypothetical protein Iba_chr09cCG12210 [Ipomoea batatas]
MASTTLPTSDRPVTGSPPSTSHTVSVPWRMLPRQFEELLLSLPPIRTPRAPPLEMDGGDAPIGCTVSISWEMLGIAGEKIAATSTTRPPPGLVATPSPRLIAAQVLNNPAIPIASTTPCHVQNATAVPPHRNLVT